MIDTTRPVRVFRNWKQGCYSIMQGGRVCASARQVRLADVEFLVRESGRQRMLRGAPKNVHAYAVGYLVDHVHPQEQRALPAAQGVQVFYDPFRFDSFVAMQSLQPVIRADQVQLDETGAWCLDAELPLAA